MLGVPKKSVREHLVHHYHHLDPGPGLSSVIDALRDIKKELRKMSAELDKMAVEVAENTTVTGSAITLLTSLSEQIRDLSDDPAALNKLADDLDAQSNALAAAVAANTPTPPVEEPPVEPPVEG